MAEKALIKSHKAVIRTVHIPQKPVLRPADAEILKIPSATPGVELEAWLFTPQPAPSAGRVPLLVMSHGMGSTMSDGLVPMARDLVRHGAFAVLCFDYRQWGASGGTPRQLLSPAVMAEDQTTVCKWCKMELNGRFETQAKLGVLGCSLGGGTVMEGAFQAEKAGVELAVVVSYVGAIASNTEPSLHTHTKEEWAWLLACMKADAKAPGSVWIQGILHPDFIGTEHDGFNYMKSISQAKVIMAERSVQGLGEYPARGFLNLAEQVEMKTSEKFLALKAPVVHVGGKYDVLVGTNPQIRELVKKKQGAPAEVMEIDCEHFSVYPMMNQEMYARTKAWMGDDPQKTYKPEIYPECIRRLALRLREIFAGSTLSKL